MARIIVLISAILLTCTSQAKQARELDISIEHIDAIGKAFAIIEEGDVVLTQEQVLRRYQSGDYSPATSNVISRGLNSAPLWLVAELHNPTTDPTHKHLSIATTWLDRIDAYFVSDSGNQAHTHLTTGDSFPYSERHIDSRHFTFNYDYPPGTTLVLLRVETTGPMTLPIYLCDHDHALLSDRLSGYLYGFIYGVIISLMLYNLMLAISLRNPINLYYSVFTFTFLAMNLTYTGHGYAWLWGDSPLIQHWAPSFFMGCYIVWGLFFGVRFLNLRHHLPWLHRTIMTCISIIGSTLLLCVAASWQSLAIHLTFYYMIIFAVGTLILGAIAAWRNLPSANYFLAATLLGVTGALITTLTVWGMIEYHPIGFMAIDIGMAIEAILLSLALAHQLNQIKNEKAQAEHLARIDPLTGLTNRRAFDELANPIWSNAERNNRHLSLIMIDIDHFKMINDEFGHPVGDRVIQEVAKQLKQQCRAGDILARWGGEEFLLLLPETSLEQANHLAERYRSLILDITFSEGDIQIKPTASFGVATKDSYNDSLRRAITAADNLLYVAKQTGRNRVCVQKASDTAEPEQLSLHQGT